MFDTGPEEEVFEPARPDFRGVTTPVFQMSLEADPTFEELEEVGGIVSKYSELHTVLNVIFSSQGTIPRITAYELGLRRRSRFIKETGKWEKDESILDERFVMCKIKGLSFDLLCRYYHADNFKGKGIVMFS